MEQELNKIIKAYDTTAEEYALKFADDHEKKPEDREVLLRFAQEIGTGSPVWDFGCGPGQTTAYLKNLGIEISGLDISEKMIEQSKINHPGIHFKKGNILGLEFEDNSISGIVSFYAIVHFNRKQTGRVLSEIFRVLKPGGISLLTYHIGDETIRINEFLGRKVDIDFMFFSNDFIFSSMKLNGFEKIEIIERDPYPGIEYESRRAYVFAHKPGL